ncbi:winged helix-turn-helix domain-containing protein, partial [Candidatus Margulisiibacteriota bacterium]
MKSFKDIAYSVLKKADKALRSDEITKIAIRKGILKPSGKTPAATMGAQLYMDIKNNGKKSRFLKVGPSTFTVNPTFKEELKKRKLRPGEKKVMSEEYVKRAVIFWLTSHGWGTNLQFGALNERGVDIKVRNNKYPRYFLIEVKGESSAKSARSIAETSFV